MTPTEIDRKLALAIGYRPEDVKVYSDGSVGVVRHEPYGNGGKVWRYQKVFSHQDPTVILPIMERYDCHSFPLAEGGFEAFVWSSVFVHAYAKHTNPRTAAALAVIKAKEVGLI